MQICQVANHDDILPLHHNLKLLDWTVRATWVQSTAMFMKAISDNQRWVTSWVILLNGCHYHERMDKRCKTHTHTHSFNCLWATSQSPLHRQQPAVPQNTTQNGFKLSYCLPTSIIQQSKGLRSSSAEAHLLHIFLVKDDCPCNWVAYQYCCDTDG